MTQPTEAVVEIVARAIWEARRVWARARFHDGIELEEWGDGSIPKLNGIMGEARAALTAAARAKAQALQQISDNIVEKVETRPDHPETAAAQVRERAEWAVLDSYAAENQRFSDEIERLRAALAKIRKEDERESHPCGPQEYGYLGRIAHDVLASTAAGPALMLIYGATEDQGPDVLGIRKGEE